MVIDWKDPAVRRVLVLMLPVTLTIGLINVNFLIGTIFASRLLDPELAPAAIDKAFRLYMLPQGIFSVAVTTVLFPTLARLAARADTSGLRRALDGGLRQIAFLLVPAALVSIVLADPIVRLLYERGEFTRVRHGGRRRLPAGVLGRARLQRLDAHPQPQLLRRPVELDPDLHRARRGRAECRVQRDLLPVRSVGDPACDHPRQRRGSGGIAGDDATAGRAYVVQPHVRGRRARRPRGAASPPPRHSSSGTASTRALGRSAGAQLLSLGAALALAGIVYAGAAKVLGVRELEALLLLRGRPDEP